MLNCVKHLRLSKHKFRLSICNRTQSSLAPNSVLRKSKELPDGVALEILNPNKHDVGKVRKLLVDAFVLNQEPIMHTLCESAYSDLPMNKKLPKIERQFEKFFSDQFLTNKIEQGLSIVAVEKGNAGHGRYISSAFVEQYNEGTYTELRLLRDPFWKYGLRLMSDLHKQACPFLSQYDRRKIAFVSHAATYPEYVSSGLMETIIDLFLSRLPNHGFELVYGVVTTEAIGKFIEKRFGYLPIAEIMYADYEIDGAKVFHHLAEECVSTKAMVKFL